LSDTLDRRETGNLQSTPSDQQYTRAQAPNHHSQNQQVRSLRRFDGNDADIHVAAEDFVTNIFEIAPKWRDFKFFVFLI